MGALGVVAVSSLIALSGSALPAIASASPGEIPTVVPTTAVAGTPVPTPITDHCPHRESTPPAVDTSEVVAPGATTPTPLPVPDPPRGGDRLGECGVVADPAAGAIPDRINSAGWLIADMDSGTIVAAKDPHGRYRPASTIKVLLALVVLDEIDLNKTVEATAEDWAMEGDSCGMGPGGRYTNRELLTGLLVVSGNDCANNLARQLGGTEKTLEKMNAKAASLGALDTRAASPSGLDAAGCSTSPYDLALFFREAMKNETFRELIGLREFRFPGYPKRADVPGDTDHPAWMMATSNHLLLEEYPGTVGGKTGYTDDARKTFVGAVERNGRRLIIVQMCGLNELDNSYWDQAKRLLDYGFAAPVDTSVGTLDASSSTTEGSTVVGAPATDAPAQQASADRPMRQSVRIIIGIVAAIAALILLSIALNLIARRRR